MIHYNPIWRSMAVLGAAGLVLTACGDSDKAIEPPASSTAGASAAAARGDGELVIGTLLPRTGSLAFLGPPEFAGVGLAVKEINAAGGVNGKPVRQVDSDSGDMSINTASQSVDRLLSNRVDAIVGAASSSVSLSVIDKITGNGVLQISPANTSDEFTNYADKGLYFRTAPPAVVQGRVLGDLIRADGNATVGILALRDAYGTSLADQVTRSITAGGGRVVGKVTYNPMANRFASEVARIKAADPEAIAVISFDETKKIIPEMVKQGIGPSTKKVYFVTGNVADYSADFPKGTLTGVKATQPGAAPSADFQAKLKAVDPTLTAYNYGSEAYDATLLTALAAVAAKDDSGASIAAKMVAVSSGGEKCTDFKACADLLAAGKDIDFDGVSGPVEFNAKGDPAETDIGIYRYGAGNTFTFVETKKGKI